MRRLDVFVMTKAERTQNLICQYMFPHLFVPDNVVVAHGKDRKVEELRHVELHVDCVWVVVVSVQAPYEHVEERTECDEGDDDPQSPTITKGNSDKWMWQGSGDFKGTGLILYLV